MHHWPHPPQMNVIVAGGACPYALKNHNNACQPHRQHSGHTTAVMPPKKKAAKKGAKKDGSRRELENSEEDTTTAQFAALKIAESIAPACPAPETTIPAAAPPATPARVRHLLPNATPVSLYAYLSSFWPEPPSVGDDATAGHNTRHETEYGYKDIREPVGAWTEFSLASCRARFGTQLDGTSISEQPSLITPQKDDEEKDIACETDVVIFLARTLFAHLNRALKASGFALRDRCGGRYKSQVDRVGITIPGRQVRLAGEVKVSWKWRSSWRERGTEGELVEYRQVLSQVHSYMNAAGCRWGYVLTDREFVALQRGEEFGELHVAEAVPLMGGEGDWTPALAAWYLYVLAQADGDEWCLPHVPRPKKKKAGLRSAKAQLLDGEEEAVPPRRSPRVRELQSRNEADKREKAGQSKQAGKKPDQKGGAVAGPAVGGSGAGGGGGGGGGRVRGRRGK
ncbi:hypothetical protein FN846DRAFT_947750 [Sphaerosporella brunnea]|uniref:Uncharacterized protein n=1 Tax=Sphaerosporella brunnea TaxID=1250544 RepID=A0A5J5EY18_9PEZI|nr:hypothetical protein FN846DRAFT_947750 [Sphaerosporella brunnea]